MFLVRFVGLFSSLFCFIVFSFCFRFLIFFFFSGRRVECTGTLVIACMAVAVWPVRWRVTVPVRKSGFFLAVGNSFFCMSSSTSTQILFRKDARLKHQRAACRFLLLRTFFDLTPRWPFLSLFCIGIFLERRTSTVCAVVAFVPPFPPPPF